jgi:hypothetical protein
MMNYCNWKDLVIKITRRFPPEYGRLPDGCIFVVGDPKREHSVPGWVSIGLEAVEKQEDWMILAGLAPSKKYTPMWDVYAKNSDVLKEELVKAIEWIEGRKIVYDESHNPDFEESRR